MRKRRRRWRCGVPLLGPENDEGGGGGVEGGWCEKGEGGRRWRWRWLRGDHRQWQWH